MVKTKERSLCELDYFKLFNDTCQMIINVIQTIIILVTVLRTKIKQSFTRLLNQSDTILGRESAVPSVGSLFTYKYIPVTYSFQANPSYSKKSVNRRRKCLDFIQTKNTTSTRIDLNRHFIKESTLSLKSHNISQNLKQTLLSIELFPTN